MKTISDKDRRVLDALQAAVTEKLEKKRRLGHYAVIWQDGKPVAIGKDAPTPHPDEYGSAETL